MTIQLVHERVNWMSKDVEISGRVLPPLIIVLQTIAFMFRHREFWQPLADSTADTRIEPGLYQLS